MIGQSGLTPAERREYARIAANARWSRPGARAEQSNTLRAAHRRRLAAQVDPDGTMSPPELSAAIDNANDEIIARLNIARLKAARLGSRRGDKSTNRVKGKSARAIWPTYGDDVEGQASS